MKKVFWGIVLIVVSAVCAGQAAAELASIAEVEDCLDNEALRDCESKKVLSVDVSYGIQTVFNAISITTIQKDGEPVDLEEKTHITIEKSIPTLTYPLSYFHTVPYFPYEKQIEVQLSETDNKTVDGTCAESPDATGIAGVCIDDPEASNPTCGWVYEGSEQIPGSQGGCGGTTARCMRQGELMYAGYEIRPFKEDFNVTVSLNGGSPSNEDEEYEFELRPSAPFHRALQLETGFGIKAALDATSAVYQGAPQLDNYILYIPVSPDTHPMVLDYQHNMLLVPREEVSRDGSECNKVGVSFTAFRDYARSCPEEGGGCLDNQLFHKHNSDLQKLILNPDAEATYLVHGKKIFKGSMDFAAGMEKVLKYKVPEINNSRVALTMALDTLEIVSTESQGVIKEAYVLQFDSMSRNGTMVVDINNYNDIKTDYVVTVTDCTMNIVQAIPAQARVLEPEEIAKLTFDIDTNYNLDSENECLVSLKSPTGRLYDDIVVKFDTLKHSSDYSWELREENNETEEKCKLQPQDCSVPEICDNEIDDNCDGLIDGDDPECAVTTIEDLADRVAGLDLSLRSQKSLSSLVGKIEKSILKGKPVKATHDLMVFIQLVRDMIGVEISTEEAGVLINYANDLIDQLRS